MARLASSCSAFLEGQSVRIGGLECVRRVSGLQSSVKCVQIEHGEATTSGSSNGNVQVSRRQAVWAVIAGGVVLSQSPRASALLESDDDDALLEKVKEDKKKRIQRRATAINDFRKETESVQVAVYKLSKAGQAIDGGDFSTASSVLATKSEADWVRDLKAALSKVSANSEEQSEADTFGAAFNSLQAAVRSGDAESSRSAFVASASSLEKWTRLTGLSEQVMGL